MTLLRSIAVTGSAGRVGSGICTLARRQGLRVVGLDKRPDAVSIKADIREHHALAKHFEGVDCVIHCAGLHAPHVGVASDDAFRAINVDGTASVLRAIAIASVPRIVLTSSTALLGGGSDPGQPARWIDDTTQPAPRTIYHETKLVAEAKVRNATGPSLKASIIRLGRCFDEGTRLNTLYRLSRGISVEDAAAAHLCAARACDLDSEPQIACADTPFERDDASLLGSNARLVIKKRCPEVLKTFAAHQWEIPQRVDRIYACSSAQRRWHWRPMDNIQAA
ncbi:MAG: NAD(P)-dependent oxidoreductase, partial [Hyphomicrobiaceae bacterium]|nr:NAD(P)-dependent oxidoreductase [Hyphomicrobiaceae bacterium]